MKKYLLSLGLIVAATLSLTSCLGSGSSDTEYTFAYGPNDCFNRVVDTQTGETYIGLNPTYKMVFNTSQQTLAFEMSNLKFSGNYQGLSFRFPEMPFTVDANDSFFVATGSNITPVGLTSAYVFDDFTLRACLFRPIPAYVLDYTVENRYRVTAYPTNPAYLGSISATNLDPKEGEAVDFNSTNDAESWYQLLINPEKMTAIFAVTSAKYSQTMTRYDFAVRDLPIVLNDYGYTITTDADTKYDLYSPSSVTSATATPLKDCSISNIRITGVLRTGANISFDCDLGENGKYSVRAVLRYLLYNQNNGTQQ